MYRIITVAVLGLSLAAGAAFAQDQTAADAASPAPAAQPAPAAAPAPAAPAAPVKKERKICRQVDTTGSRVGGSNVCLTKAEWDARAARDGNAVDKIQRGNLNVGDNPH